MHTFKEGGPLECCLGDSLGVGYLIEPICFVNETNGEVIISTIDGRLRMRKVGPNEVSVVVDSIDKDMM